MESKPGVIMKSILQREKELFNETWRLKQASFEITKQRGNKNYNKSRELQEKEKELYKKQQFFKGFLKEMEKIGK
jgi:hypothetical protein